MYKKLICLVSLLVVSAFVGNIAANTYTDAGPTHLWNDPCNWSHGVPFRSTSGADNPYRWANMTVDGTICIIDSTIPDANSNGFYPGCYGGDSSFYMTGGGLNVQHFNVGRGRDPGTKGYAKITGGVITVTGSFQIPNQFDLRPPDTEMAQGHMDLHGGVIYAPNFTMGDHTDAHGGGVGTMDITEGTLIVNGDNVSKIQGYIDDGWITPYGGEGKIELDYDGRNPGKTTLSAIFMLQAYNPRPADMARDAQPEMVLSWEPGLSADKHDVYFGTDFDHVSTSTTPDSAGQDPNYYPLSGELDLNLETTYYWRVDEVADPCMWKGKVWSFTTGNYIAVDDVEGYTDSPPGRIFDVWLDGWGVATNGALVGYDEPPIAERNIVHEGRQSMPFYYDNTSEATSSEASRTFDPPQDWTRKDVKALTLWFRGHPASVGSFSQGPAGAYTLTSGGADIGGTADEFRYAYKMLSGPGQIVARVVDMANTDPNAKAGIMIRESLDPGSKYAMVSITPSQGVSFLRRTETGGDTDSTTETGVGDPRWLKLIRDASGKFTAKHAEDVDGWPGPWLDVEQPPEPSFAVVGMNKDVYIGLALTSHNLETTCQAEFSDVMVTGSITGAWTSENVGIITNTADQMYVTLEDEGAAGNSTTVTHDDPDAVLKSTWQEWRIDLGEFSSAGVNLARIKKMTIGFGGAVPGGAGKVYFDDIRLYLPRCLFGNPPRDLNGDCIVDFADISIFLDSWLDKKLWQ